MNPRPIPKSPHFPTSDRPDLPSTLLRITASPRYKITYQRVANGGDGYFRTNERVIAVRVLSCETTSPFQTMAATALKNPVCGRTAAKKTAAPLKTTTEVAGVQARKIADSTKTIAICFTVKTTTNELIADSRRNHTLAC
jgi:hypothetical protein